MLIIRNSLLLKASSISPSQIKYVLLHTDYFRGTLRAPRTVVLIAAVFGRTSRLVNQLCSRTKAVDGLF